MISLMENFKSNEKTSEVACFSKNSNSLVGDNLGEEKRIIVCGYYFKFHNRKLLNFFRKTSLFGSCFEV